ncbi:MAG TPA: hypothetical protein DDW83_01805 [Peptococcaceae bacterium]|nr:hypothetical protein [Peptococcaceae bacterium]
MSDILRWQEVKTRKPHKCWGCDKEYPAGTQMISAAYADGGTVFGGYWCKTCQEYMHRHFESGDECEQGEIYENDPDGWEAIKAEREGIK